MKKDKLKKEIETGLIEVWKPLFDAYPELDAIPVYAWGRHHFGELAGDDFEYFVDESGFMGFRYNNIDRNLNFELLDKIDDEHNIPDGKIWTGEWGDYEVVREDAVKVYDFDERYGKCLVVEKNEEGILSVGCYDCISSL